MTQPADPQPPEITSEFLTWLRIGLLSFGGPAAHIALIQSEICDRLNWSQSRDFVQGLSFATLLPGPEAMQLGVYLGWRYGGIKSGIIAGLGFVLPGAAIMIVLTLALDTWRGHGVIAAIFAGVQPVIMAFVALALWRIARQVMTGLWASLIALSSFTALYGYDVPFPWIALAAALIGLAVPRSIAAGDSEDAAFGDTDIGRPPTARILAIGIATAIALTGLSLMAPQAVFHEIAVNIGAAVLVVFGGAYAVIGYVADQAVGALGWLTPAQVIDGLALAETAPGPLILFNAFAGTMAASDSGLAAGIAGGVLATAITFLPSFVLVLAGAPYVSRLYGNPWLQRALAGVTAAVIGLIASLAALLASAVLWTGDRMNIEAVMVTVLALMILMTKRLPAPILIALGAMVGIARWALVGV